MLDVILNWSAVCLPIILSIVGVLVSIKAPHSKHHTAWRFSLVGVGVIVSAVTLWQQAVSRASHAAEISQLEQRLSRIEHNTAEPPKVVVNVPPYPTAPKEQRTWIDFSADWASGKGPPFRSGSGLDLNVWFRNNPGNVPATNFQMFQRATERDHRLKQKEEDVAYRTFVADTRKIQSPARTLVPGGVLWLTIHRERPFTEKEAADVANLKLWTYMFVLARYSDDTGPHETEVCLLYSGTGSTAVNCYSHNGPSS